MAQPESQPEKLDIRHRMDELESMFPLHTSELTLGHAAVIYANHHAAIILEMSQYGEETDEYQRYSVLARSFGSSIVAELQDVRQVIAGISFNNESYLDRYLEVQTHLTHVVRMMGMAEKKFEAPLTWKQWLSQHATNDELLAFLQFHNQIIERQQTNPQIREAMDAQKQKFIEATQYLREVGALAESSEDLDGVELYVGDIFNMALKEQIGFYTPGTSKIHLQQAYLLEPSKLIEEFLANIPHTGTHELVHAVLGESHKRLDSPLAARWINEAITEELTRAIIRKTGSMDEEDTTYLDERALLNLLLSHGSLDNTLAYKLAMLGFSGSKDDRDMFEAYLDTVWGTKDTLGKLNQAIELEEANYPHSDPKSLRSAQEQALKSIRMRLQDNPDSIFVQYEEATKILPKFAAQK